MSFGRGSKRQRPDEVESSLDALPVDMESMKAELVKFLEPGETVTRALKRLRTSKRGDFEVLTSTASTLLDHGYHMVYTDTREEIFEAPDPEVQPP